MKDSITELLNFDKVHKNTLKEREKQKAKEEAKKNYVNKADRVLMSDLKIQELEKAEKSMEGGDDRNVSTIDDRKWRFIVDHDPERGLIFDNWKDTGVKKIDIEGFLHRGEEMDLGAMLADLRKVRDKERGVVGVKKNETG